MLVEAASITVAFAWLSGNRSPLSSMKSRQRRADRRSVPLTFGSTFCSSCSSSAFSHGTPSARRLVDVGVDLVEDAERERRDRPERVPDLEQRRRAYGRSSEVLRRRRRGRSSSSISCARS